MSKYIIHACPERMWYVDDYLVPLLVSQGIDDLDIWCDYPRYGNLESCMRMFSRRPNNNDGTWYLQDDVIVCRDFKKITEENDFGIVCGFTSMKSEDIGSVHYDKMWWSFPCIRIPNDVARECGNWYFSFAKDYAKYYEWVQMKKCDDNMFRAFLEKYYPYMDIVNLKPNLVDHVDWLIGGSMVNQYRGDAQIRAAYFEDLDLVDKLRKDLERRNE